MQYRRDLDGLRAVAILLVLIYHADLSFLKSGFIGVDVFFVISGFLITSIIHASMNNNDFSFIDFYNRRLWRLQPIFICLIVLSTALTLIFFLPEDLIQFSRSARKTSLFISNIFFNNTTTGYFSPDTQLLPLLHTWSLSIEWQCYLILPLIMYLLHRLFNSRYVILVVYALTFASLILSLHASDAVPAQTYYQFSSRCFEFLIGSCIALMPLNRFSINTHIISFSGVLSLVAIGYIANLDNILLGYPNGYAFSVCLATALLIAIGKHYPEHFLVKILSVRPLVFIGLLSFSLYIWHWMVLSLLRYQGIQQTWGVLVWAYGIAFILSYLSWRYIEKPSRRFNHIKFRYTFVSLLLLPILFTHLSSYVIKSNFGFPQRFNQELVSIYQKLEHSASDRRPKCIDKENVSQCRIGDNHPHSKKALMIGDSISNHFWGFMDILGQDAGVSIVSQGKSSCLTLPGIYLYDWWYFKNRVYKECHDKTANYYRMIQANHYDYVIIGQIWESYLSDNVINLLGDRRSLKLTKQRLKKALDSALNSISESGAKPVLIKSTAVLQGNFRKCFLKHIKLYPTYTSEQCSFNFEVTKNRQWLDSVFAEMKIKYPQLVVIDPKDVQCHNNSCKAEINRVPVYRDKVHITDYASYQFGSLYLRHFGNPLVGV